MRLIDADIMRKNIIAKDKNQLSLQLLDVLTRWINKQPTIDAIPIGWLIDRANDHEKAPLYRRYAQRLYEEWQKEQEGKHCEIHD